jgi:hypothetical protein
MPWPRDAASVSGRLEKASHSPGKSRFPFFPSTSNF